MQKLILSNTILYLNVINQLNNYYTIKKKDIKNRIVKNHKKRISDINLKYRSLQTLYKTAF